MGREGHKENCACVVCKRMRAKAAVPATDISQEIPEVPVKQEPVEVELGTLKATDLFTLNGKPWRVGQVNPVTILCDRLEFMSFGPTPAEKMWRVVQRSSMAHWIKVIPNKEGHNV